MTVVSKYLKFVTVSKDLLLLFVVVLMSCIQVLRHEIIRSFYCTCV